MTKNNQHVQLCCFYSVCTCNEQKLNNYAKTGRKECENCEMTQPLGFGMHCNVSQVKRKCLLLYGYTMVFAIH